MTIRNPAEVRTENVIDKLVTHVSQIQKQIDLLGVDRLLDEPKGREILHHYAQLASVLAEFTHAHNVGEK